MIHRDGLTPRPWGAGCKSWDLVDGTGLIVVHEQMPPGTAEQRHRHRHARQFFFVLRGELQIAVDDVVETLRTHEGLEIPPGRSHQVFNRSAHDVEFLAIASPSTKGDRTAS